MPKLFTTARLLTFAFLASGQLSAQPQERATPTKQSQDQNGERSEEEEAMTLSLLDIIHRSGKNERIAVSAGFDRRTGWKPVSDEMLAYLKNKDRRIVSVPATIHQDSKQSADQSSSSQSLEEGPAIYFATLKRIDRASGIAEVVVGRYTKRLDANGYKLSLIRVNGRWLIHRRNEFWMS